MSKRIRRTGSFKARDSDGRVTTIVVYTEFHDAGDHSGGTEIPGLKSLMTEGGLSVNRLAKGHYEVVQTGEELRSDDPNAV